MAAKKKLQVFVSSTYLDLKNERQAAVEAILKAGHIPAGMELFAAGNESQFETIRRWIDESDTYMLILGGRYGSIEPKTSLSYVELEYDYAVLKNKPVFAVVISDSALDQKVKTDGRVAIESEHPKELKSFREKVLSRISSFFSDSKDIKLAVHETLSDFMARYEFTGWVSGSEVAESAALLEEISRLQKRNNELAKELSDLKVEIDRGSKNTSTKFKDEELVQILKRLDIPIETDVFDKSKPAKKYSAARLLNAMRDTLITGVTSRVATSGVETFLFYNLCPKLAIHGLAAIERVPSVAWQRCRLTPKGKALLDFIDRTKFFDRKEKGKAASGQEQSDQSSEKKKA
jgi:hypothetical protein